MTALDASAIICLVEQIDVAAQSISDQLAATEGRILVSSVAITECLTLPLRTSDERLRERYERFFAAPHVLVRPVDVDTANLAARLRAATRLKTPDAIHLATGVVGGATTFLTTDADFVTAADRVALTIQVIPRKPDH